MIFATYQLYEKSTNLITVSSPDPCFPFELCFASCPGWAVPAELVIS
jgi:hypothetical protein